MRFARILLADDDSKVREKVADLLRSDFEVVGSVQDGQQAIESAVRLHPDVAVLDISMPIVNGMQVAAYMRDVHLGAKVIFLTVHEDQDYVHGAFSVGASGYVLKTRFLWDLIPAIEGALEGRRFVSEFPVRH